MSGRHDLIAYLATLGVLAGVYCASLYAAGHGVTVTEAFGLGTITGGLIGILRIPTARSVRIDQPASDPIPVEPKP